MARVTALRERARGRVTVELDGAPWRTLPADVVVRAGLLVGVEVDRARARTLRRELRRAEALGVAARALRARDRSTAELGARLARAGVAAPVQEDALATLERAGLVDDARFARSRAEALAERGYGDEGIRWDLERHGVGTAIAAEAVAALEPEAERASAIIRSRGAGRATAAFLARRGFAEEAVELAFGVEGDRG